MTGETPTVYLTIMQSSTPTPTVEWNEALVLVPYLDNPEVWSWLEQHGALNRNTLTWVHVSTNSDPTPVRRGGARLALTVPVSERDALDAAIKEGMT